MLHVISTHKETLELISGLFSSIKEINRRLDELSWANEKNIFTRKGKNEVKIRISKLTDTRLNLMLSIYSMKDIHVNITGNKSELYSELKQL